MLLFKNGDILLVLIILAFIYFYYSNYVTNSNSQCRSFNIYHSDKLIATIKSSSDTLIVVNGVKIKISNQSADVIESSCPNKICKNHNSINRVSQRIVCVPNRVSIIAVGDGGFDAISE